MKNRDYPRFTISPPEDVKIYPNLIRRFAFWCVGCVAIILRIITFPIRRFLKKRDLYLVYEPYGMGDVIALQPLVVAIAKSGGRVIVAIKKEWHEIIPKHENIILLPINVSYSKYRNKKAGVLSTIFHTSQLLRSVGCGAIGLDVRGDVRSITMMYLAGCSRVESLSRYYTANDCRVPCGCVARRHKIDKSLLRFELNKAFLPQTAEAYFTAPDVLHLLNENATLTISKKRVALVPLAGWFGKEWLPEAWKEFIGILIKNDYDVIVLCGPGEREKVIDSVGGGALLDEIEFLEQKSVGEWVNALYGSDCVVSVNTGPMHIAAALKKPQIVIEGTSRIPLWSPANSNAVVIHYQNGKEIRAIHQIDSNAEYSRRVMSKISADEVFSVMEKLLKKE